MKQSVRLGRIGGIPIGAHWSVAIILVIITELLATTVLPAALGHQHPVLYWMVGAVAAVLFLASLAAHELAHALVARRNGVGVKSVTLWMLGGVTELEGDPPGPGADLRIALAGPAASLAAAAVFLGAGVAIGAAGGPAIAVGAATWLAVMNAVLAAFNLLPGAPLDGGRVLRAVLWRHYADRRRAQQAAARSGRFLGMVIVGIGIAEFLILRSIGGLWLILIGWFLISAAAAEERTTAATAALSGVRIADVMTPQPDLAPGWNTVAEFAEWAAAWSRQESFPVIGFDGALIGVILASQLAGLPAGDRATLRLDQLALPVPPEYRAAPDDPASALLGRRPIGGEVLAVVLADGKVTGLVTVADLQQAVRWRALAGTRS